MSKKTALALAFIAAILLIISYCHFGSPPNSLETVSPEAMGTPEDSVMAKTKTSAKADLPPVQMEATIETNGFLPTQMEDSGRFEAFQKALKEMAPCLNMIVTPLDAQVEINFETLNAAIDTDLGDVVTQSEEWIATDIKTKAGEFRRIYIENQQGPETEIFRTMRYFSYSSEGVQRELPLTQEQMKNPSEALIASLESDGDVVSRAVSRRIFYQNGDDLLLVEKDGQIFSFELSHDGATFRCTGANKSSTFQCQCR